MAKITLAVTATLCIFSSAAIADETMKTNYDTNSQLIDLGEGITATWARGAPCFTVRRSTQKSETASYTISISDTDHSHTDKFDKDVSSSMSIGFQAGFGGGSADTSNQSRESDTFSRDDKSTSVTIDFNVSAGREYVGSMALNEYGLQIAQQGALAFVTKCGSLIASNIERTIKVRATVKLESGTVSQRREVTTALAGGMGGNYYGVTAGATFKDVFDKVITDNTSQLKINASLFIRANDGVKGVSAFISGLQNIRTSPFSTIVSAISKLIEAREGDVGAIDQVTFTNFDAYLANVTLVDWQVRRDFWRKADDARSAIRKIKMLRVGGQYPFPSEPIKSDYLSDTQQLLHEHAWKRTCLVQDGQESTESQLYNHDVLAYICSSADGNQYDQDEYDLTNATNACLSAQGPDACDKSAIYLAVMNIAKYEPYDRTRYTYDYIVDRFVNDVNAIWMRYSAPPHFLMSDLQGHTHPISLTFDASEGDLYLVVDTEASIRRVEAAGLKVDYFLDFASSVNSVMSSERTNAQWAVHNLRTGEQPGYAQSIKGAMTKFNDDMVDLYLDVETVNGRERLYIASLR